ncbi:hypothetical protein [Flavobacterium sp.]|uniref:hypothetical protein n=1 Tax=Flavobacterium sp. TaxID=239 RepID=UPI0022C5597A|nr:hypothetical protein [Flavobacterium sp.]MCZ8091818.1 hypothetical protein [Flavobacterium sp.]
MSINGIRLVNEKEYSIFYVDNFSNELKNLIRENLQSICNGFSDVQDDLYSFFSYQNTLKFFFETYDTKEESIRKGIIGELLAHLLIPTYHNNLKSTSILKNFEENQIKKGFDIVYYDYSTSNLWYSESKSGRSGTSVNSTIYNKVLLYKSRAGMLEMFNSGRNKLWDKARSEVDKTIEINKGRIDIKNMLAKDSPIIAAKNKKKKVILISILYHNLLDEIEPISVKSFQEKTHKKGIFDETFVLSIQKEAYESVETFLKSEIIS